MIQTSTSQDKGLKLQKGTHIWVNLITTSLFSRTLESWFILGKSSPFMAQQFRLVNYCNLPRNIVVIKTVDVCRFVHVVIFHTGLEKTSGRRGQTSKGLKHIFFTM